MQWRNAPPRKLSIGGDWLVDFPEHNRQRVMGQTMTRKLNENDLQANAMQLYSPQETDQDRWKVICEKVRFFFSKKRTR
jgi:hypothetical protein